MVLEKDKNIINIGVASWYPLQRSKKLLDKKDFIITKEMSADKALKMEIEKVQKETVKKIKREDNELWIEDDE